MEKQLRAKHAKSFGVDCFSSGTHGLEETVQFLRHLDRWFALAAIQANNWWPPHEAAGVVIPSFMELSYVSRDVLPDAFTCVPMTQAQVLRHAAPERKAVANVAALSPWDAFDPASLHLGLCEPSVVSARSTKFAPGKMPTAGY